MNNEIFLFFFLIFCLCASLLALIYSYYHLCKAKKYHTLSLAILRDANDKLRDAKKENNKTLELINEMKLK